MDPYRVRVRLADTPGRLGSAAAALGAFGINIIDVDVHSVDGGAFADDLLIDLTVPIDLPVVEYALRQADCELVHLQRVDPHELTDSLTRALELAHGLAAGGVDDDQLAEAARTLVRADLASITTVHDDGPLLRGVAAEAVRRGSATQRREPTLRLAHRGDFPWVLAIPFEQGPVRRVLGLARRNPSFSFTETARVQALLRFAPPAREERPEVTPGTGRHRDHW